MGGSDRREADSKETGRKGAGTAVVGRFLRALKVANRSVFSLTSAVKHVVRGEGRTTGKCPTGIRPGAGW